MLGAWDMSESHTTVREEGDEEQVNGVERFFEYLSFQF